MGVAYDLQMKQLENESKPVDILILLNMLNEDVENTTSDHL